MVTTLTIPKLEMSMTEGTLAEWMFESGEEVKEGEVIYILETDKTAREIEAPASGIFTQKVPEGETYPVGTEIGEIA
jgi:pyruvate/2-oxoglutarate dehydrogenase complex dihydrolipoamide acyltransferase (E2) component